jgi:superfamily II DNA/RNA helicase
MSGNAETFEELGLSESTVNTLIGLGYGQPTPFQALAIRSLTEKHDLLARTDNDPGNPAAYALPIIERILKDGPAYNPTALILVPTRELAIQVHEDTFQLTARGAAARVLGLFEGKPLTSQIGPLKHGVDIVVGTPGRVLEHVKRKTLRIEQLRILVLDRVDEMLDLGLAQEIETIIGVTPKTRQTVLFSATSPPRVLRMALQHLRDPALISITAEDIETAARSEAPSAAMLNLYFGAGKGAGISPRDLVGLLSNEGGLAGDQIGPIKIKQNFSLVAVPAEDAKNLVSKLRSSRIKGRKAKIRLERF